jgi:hypothetical protein
VLISFQPSLKVIGMQINQTHTNGNRKSQRKF